MKQTFLSIVALSLFSVSIAQNTSKLFPIPCNTYDAMEEAFSKDPNLRTKYNLIQSEMELEYKNAISTSQTGKTAATVYTVPVVFHILHQGGVENVSDADINTAMLQINKDYRKLGADIGTINPAFSSLYVDAEITFQLAKKDPNGNCTNGIIRHYDANTNWSQTNVSAYAYSGNGTNRWATNKYLNIYIVKCISSATSPCPPTGGFIVGYTYLPGSSPGVSADAIVYRYDFLASGTEARSLSHEIGHWLNLTHVFGSTNNPGVTCGDDVVSDTPITKGYFSTCPGSNAGPFTGCSTTENMENFMDYSSCPKMFTQLQVVKMRSAITSASAGRSNLWSATNLAFTGITSTTTCTPVANLMSNKTANCSGNSITYTDLSQYGTTGSPSWTFEGGTPSTSTSSVQVVTYNTPGTYSVSLTATNPYGTNTLNKNAYVSILNAWSPYTAPITENFEASSLPWDMTIKNNNAGSITWAQNNSNGALGSPKCIFLNNASQSNTAGHLDIFETPVYNCQNTTGLSFSFYYAYAKKTTAQADTFKLQVSTDCGGSWQNVIGYPSASTMASNSGGISATPFNPTASQWKQHSISASLLAATNPNPNLKQSVKFRFYFKSDVAVGSSNNIYIDQINLSGIVGLNELESNINLSMYPNPTDKSSEIKFNLYHNENAEISITDLYGRILEVIDNLEITNQEVKQTINKNGHLSQGIYFVNIKINDATLTKKLIIQ